MFKITRNSSPVRTGLFTTEQDNDYTLVKGIHYRDGRHGKDGNDGRLLELRKNDKSIQWRYKEDENWIELVNLEEIKGNSGEKGPRGESSVNYHGFIDGGRADSVYTNDQNLGGGGAE
jgi:hypothetical protein